jgi:hypothetical protein
MTNTIPSRPTQPAPVRTSSPRAGIISGGALLFVMGSLFAGISNFISLFSPARTPAPILITQPAVTANYAGAGQPQGVISVSFDRQGNAVMAPANDSSRLEPVQIPVAVVGS